MKPKKLNCMDYKEAFPRKHYVEIIDFKGILGSCMLDCQERILFKSSNIQFLALAFLALHRAHCDAQLFMASATFF